MNSESCNILIFSTLDDLEYIGEKYRRLIDLFPDKIFYFVGNGEIKNKLKKLNFSERVEFIDESSILPFTDIYNKVAEKLRGSSNGEEQLKAIAEAYYRQFIKISYACQCEKDYYMVWDGNHIPCGLFSMFTEKQIPYLDIQSEDSEKYVDVIKKIIPGIGKIINGSFNTGHMFFKKEIVREILLKIEENENLAGKKYWEKIINGMDVESFQNLLFSEYEMYGAYCALFYPSEYKLRRWENFKQGSEFYDINKICERDYEWLSTDFSSIVFDSKVVLQESHRNLFDNPKYQHKLTPKQMLKAVEEVFEGKLGNNETTPVEKKGTPEADCKEPDEYMTYYVMGRNLIEINSNQAYLCMENAEFLCDDHDLKEMIRNEKDKISLKENFNVRKTSFVILSYNELFFTMECLESIWKRCAPGSYEIVVVDNASTDGSVEWLEKCPYEIKLIKSETNLGFPGGCNLGIENADAENDILLLNNDTRLCHNSLFWLRMGLYENDHIGAVSAISSYGGNNYYSEINLDFPDEYVEYGAQINIPMSNPYEEKIKLEGFALLIKRNVLEEIGYMDEIFTPGYLEDDDICYRIHLAGYRMNICHNGYIYHAGSQSFRKIKNVSDLEVRNRKYFIEKWNIDNMNFKTTNLEYSVFKEFLSKGKFDSHFKMLEIGSGCGNFIAGIQYYFPNACVYGVEHDSIAAQNSMESVHTMVCEDYSKLPFLEEYFDYILISDRAGDAKERNSIEKELKKYLKDTGRIYK